MTNKTLLNAKVNASDEYYTLFNEIEEEMPYYHAHFHNKIIYSPCDSRESNFVKYFEWFPYLEPDIPIRHLATCKQAGTDMFSKPSLDLMRQSDIIITNPPFSRFSEYLDILLAEGKDFILIGSKASITIGKIKSRLLAGTLHIGITRPNWYLTPSGEKKSAPSFWYSTLEPQADRIHLPDPIKYDKKTHLTYDDLDAINIPSLKEIPSDYQGRMTLPVTAWQYDLSDFHIITMVRDKHINGSIIFPSILVQWKKYYKPSNEEECINEFFN